MHKSSAKYLTFITGDPNFNGPKEQQNFLNQYVNETNSIAKKYKFNDILLFENSTCFNNKLCGENDVHHSLQ